MISGTLRLVDSCRNRRVPLTTLPIPHSICPHQALYESKWMNGMQWVKCGQKLLKRKVNVTYIDVRLCYTIKKYVNLKINRE